MGMIAVVGLGYVGLPLAVEFAKNNHVIGFDVSAEKMALLSNYNDPAEQISPQALKEVANNLQLTTEPEKLGQADYIIITVPTPVDDTNNPDFGPLIRASLTVGNYMKKGAIIVYESTVYPGATEEVCVPALMQNSKLQWKKDFNVGYSPERINPGDREHTLTTITKVVAGDTPITLEKITKLYGSIIKAGIYPVSSIKAAEAAKVIENTQRDLNIALINELALIFHKLDIDTLEVLKAAGTKWNFLPFKPGLVGGHCIGVDPYYLTYKATQIGYHPQVILAGRRVNDDMGRYIAEQTVKKMIHAHKPVKGARVGILGLTFKENCPDIRNTKVVDIIAELQDYGVKVLVNDPLANPAEAKHEYGLELVNLDEMQNLDAIILAVAHDKFIKMPIENILSKLSNPKVLIDVKSVLDKKLLQQLEVDLWRL